MWGSPFRAPFDPLPSIAPTAFESNSQICFEELRQAFADLHQRPLDDYQQLGLGFSNTSWGLIGLAYVAFALGCPREAFSYCFASVSAGPTWFSPIGIAATNAKAALFFAIPGEKCLRNTCPKHTCLDLEKSRPQRRCSGGLEHA